MTTKLDRADEIVEQWRAELPEIAGLPFEIAKRTARLGGMLDAALGLELSKLNLTRAEYEILTTLRGVGPPYRLKPTALTTSLLLSSGGTSNVVKRMLDAGYVRRYEDPADGRSSWVQLTDEGARVAETAVRNSVAAHTALLAAVPKQKVRALAGLLREVLVAPGDGTRTP
jgi:DNA-binding MarR family transcriptional regulator